MTDRVCLRASAQREGSNVCALHHNGHPVSNTDEPPFARCSFSRALIFRGGTSGCCSMETSARLSLSYAPPPCDASERARKQKKKKRINRT